MLEQLRPKNPTWPGSRIINSNRILRLLLFHLICPSAQANTVESLKGKIRRLDELQHLVSLKTTKQKNYNTKGMIVYLASLTAGSENSRLCLIKERNYTCDERDYGNKHI